MDSQAILHKIKWNNHKKEIIEEQQYLFENSLSCDCVLISAEGKHLKAHQVVLSSSSEFFRKMLSELPPSRESPTIHVPDADTCVLEAILKFVYTGETTIVSTCLTSLLEFCNFLDIKGCVANGFTLNGCSVSDESEMTQSESISKSFKNPCESWSSEEYLIVARTDGTEINEEGNELNEYLEEYLDEEADLFEVKEDQMLSDCEFNESRHFSDAENIIKFEIENPAIDIEISPTKSSTDVSHTVRRQHRPQVTRSTNSQIDKALNEVSNGKTIHRLSVEYNLPRSTLYHRFRNNENLKQNYRLERKSALDMAVRSVLHERFSLKMAADRYNIPKTAIWREVRKCEQYQPSMKEVTAERQNAQLEILSGKSLTSISAKYGIPLTTLHRDKKKLSIEGKLPESFRVKDRTENSEYGQRLEMALKKCRSGMSQYQAAKLYNIPKATMWRYANALNKSTRKAKNEENENHLDT